MINKSLTNNHATFFAVKRLYIGRKQKKYIVYLKAH